jgi:four helix bundle protein
MDDGPWPMIWRRWYHFAVRIIAKKGGDMAFKFENLEVWKLAMEYLDEVYRLAERLPKEEIYNLRSQWIRAATSIALNIAEGLTGQSDQEQDRFVGYAIRSTAESAACFRIGQRRGYIGDEAVSEAMDERMDKLIRKLQSFRKSLRSNSRGTRA